jgi:hypothetical protein
MQRTIEERMDVADEKKRVGLSEFLLLRVGAVRAEGSGRRVLEKDKLAQLSQQDTMDSVSVVITLPACPPQKPIISAKERYAEASVEELRNCTRWGRLG